MPQIQIRRSISANEPTPSSSARRDPGIVHEMDGLSLFGLLVMSWVFGFVSCVGIAMLIRL